MATPPGRWWATDAARVAADPTASITTSYSPDRLGPAAPAPRRWAAASLAGDKSVTSTRPAPPDSAIAAHSRPLAPHPITTTRTPLAPSAPRAPRAPPAWFHA